MFTKICSQIIDIMFRPLTTYVHKLEIYFLLYLTHYVIKDKIRLLQCNTCEKCFSERV